MNIKSPLRSALLYVICFVQTVGESHATHDTQLTRSVHDPWSYSQSKFSRHFDLVYLSVVGDSPAGFPVHANKQ